MSNEVAWSVQQPGEPVGPVAEPGVVLAWAIDTATGEPRHISELGPERQGARSGCSCPSCRQPLTAVNAAKVAFIKRPHFRHPAGQQRDECLIVAARLAAVRLLREQGLIDLPGRVRPVQIQGFSGETFQGSALAPAERVRLSHVELVDTTRALLTLDDGRQLLVLLTATAKRVPDEADGMLATISLDVDDPAIAGMTPDELRQRLTLVPERLCWLTHWQDGALDEEARHAAREQARQALDWAEDLDESLPPALRRETLLHLEAKRILAEARELWLPPLEAEATLAWEGGELRRGSVQQIGRKPVLKVELEQRMGRVIPDVVVYVGSGPRDLVLIEITVTNHIDDERRERIRALNLPVLEIDLSRAAGRITHANLAYWLVGETPSKQWFHHPDWEAQRERLRQDLLVEKDKREAQLREQAEDARRQEEAEAKARRDSVEDSRRRAEALARRRQAALTKPVRQLASDYLDVAYEWLEMQNDSEKCHSDRASAARDRLQTLAFELQAHGYYGAGQYEVIGPRGIVDFILSIQVGHGVGFKADTPAEVLDFVRSSAWKFATVYLIAERAFSVNGTEPAHERWQQWAKGVRDSILANQDTYLRSDRYDNLLALLFEPMAVRLARPKGKAPQQSFEQSAVSHFAGGKLMQRR